MKEQILQIDAFTAKPFSGNPAAVCLLSEPRDELWMQNLAAEMNLSETAFLLPREDGFDLRWFTPACEVDLCGHATLAGAHALWITKTLKPDQTARFFTKSGLLLAVKKADRIELDFPLDPVRPVEAPAGLEDALGISWDYIGHCNFGYFLEVESEETVRRMKPNFAAVQKTCPRGVIITSAGDSEEYDFVCRVFVPALGVDEDPVTGSAHCALGPYWQRKKRKDSLVSYQASKRGGTVWVRVGEERVYLGGQAVLVFRGELAEVF